MQNEAVSHAINWGLDEFQKCKIRALISNHVVSSSESHSNSCMVVCKPESKIILTQSSQFDVGLEIYRDSSSTQNVEDFVWAIEKHSPFFVLDVDINNSDTNEVIQRDTRKAEKPLDDSNKYQLQFRRTNDGFLVWRSMSIQTTEGFLTSKVSLNLSLSINVPTSKIPSSYRSTMSTEEKEIKAYLEGGRYRPPKVSPRTLSIPINIIESLQINTWSRPLGTMNCFLCIELKNNHPWRDILIKHTEVHLERTFKVGHRYNTSTSYGHENEVFEVLYQCSPTVDNWFAMENIPSQIENKPTNVESVEDILIRHGEIFHLVVRIAPKSIVNNVGVGMVTGNGVAVTSTTSPIHASSNTPNSLNNAAISYSGILPHHLSGDFITPVDVVWDEGELGTSLNAQNTTVSSGKSHTSIVSSSSIRWSLFARSQNDIVVEINGPSVAYAYASVNLLVNVCNCTPRERI